MLDIVLWALVVPVVIAFAGLSICLVAGVIKGVKQAFKRK